jgi:hypothetical protein
MGATGHDTARVVCDSCGLRGSPAEIGPADVVARRAGARLCSRCWWRIAVVCQQDSCEDDPPHV